MNFFQTINGLLNKWKFAEYPTRRRGLKSEVAVWAREGHLVMVLGSFSPKDDNASQSVIQDEFYQYLNQDIQSIVDYYRKGFHLFSVKLVMQSGGSLQFPPHFDYNGIDVVTGLSAADIRIDIPGIGTLTI